MEKPPAGIETVVHKSRLRSVVDALFGLTLSIFTIIPQDTPIPPGDHEPDTGADISATRPESATKPVPKEDLIGDEFGDWQSI